MRRIVFKTKNQDTYEFMALPGMTIEEIKKLIDGEIIEDSQVKLKPVKKTVEPVKKRTRKKKTEIEKV